MQNQARASKDGWQVSLPVPVFRGKVEGGKLLLYDQAGFLKYRNTHEGHDVSVTVKRWRDPRSSPQNRYYWGVVVPLLADHCGYEREEMHAALKWRFLRIHDEGNLPTVQSSSALNTEEFTDYIEHVRALAAAMGVVIPDPGEAE